MNGETRDKSIVIENQFAHEKSSNQNVDNANACKYLQEVFKNDLKPDVVQMIFIESDCNVDIALENLLALVNSNESSNGTTDSNSSSPLCNGDLIRPRNPVPSFASMLSRAKSPQPTTRSSNYQNNNTSSSQKQSQIDEKIQAIKSCSRALVLMRGLPGSGKSTLAKRIIDTCGSGVIYSTDEYFLKPDGSFNCVPSLLGEAHENNRQRTREALQGSITPIIVDNTNLMEWEMEPYVILAIDNGYRIFIIEPNTPWCKRIGELAKRNKHRVSKEKLQQMAERYESISISKMVESLKRRRSANNFTSCRNPSSISTNKDSRNLTANFDQPNDYSKTFQVIEKRSPSKNRNLPVNSVKSNPVHVRCESPDLIVDQSKNYLKNVSGKTEIGLGSLLKLSQAISSESIVQNRKSADISAVDWEKDEEFTWSNRDQPQTANTSYQPLPKREKNKIFFEKKTDEKADEFSGDWFEPKQEQAHVSRLFGKVKIDWSIPPFPDDGKNLEREPTTSIHFYGHSSTQTENRDWAELELLQGSRKLSDIDSDEEQINSVCDERREIFELVVDTSKVKIDRGTSIDFAGDLTGDEKLQTLKSQFLNAPENHLKEVLDSCHGDLEWTRNLLNQFEEHHFQVDDLNLVSMPEFFIDKSLNEQRHWTQQSTENDEASGSSEDTDQPSVKAEKSFVLRMDGAFAAALQRQFGAVQTQISPSIETFYRVEIDSAIAECIYVLWQKSLDSGGAKSGGRARFTLLNGIPSEKTATPTPPAIPKGEFQEIMDLEMAIDRSLKDFQSQVADNGELYASRMKKSHLREIFPTIDPSYIDTIFVKHNYDFEKAVDEINRTMDTAPRKVPKQTGHDSEFYNNQDELDQEIVHNPEAEKHLDELRDELELLRSRRSKQLQKMCQNFIGKNFAVANYYNQQAEDILRKMNSLKKNIIDVTVAMSPDNKLDLHGCRRDEVLPILTGFLSQKQRELLRSGSNRVLVDIITGQGKNSMGAPVLKPIVLNYLTKNNFRFELMNPGQIRLVIKR